MTKEEAFKELEEYIITPISSEDRQHININVAKRVIDKICKDRDYWKLSFDKQVNASRDKTILYGFNSSTGNRSI